MKNLDLVLFELREAEQESLYFETLEDWQKHTEKLEAIEKD